MKVYTYAKCDTCRKATAFLRTHGVKFAELPIRDNPPPINEIRAMAEARGGLRKLFNTSGKDYKSLGLAAKLADLSESEILALLAGNGNLIKRPFAFGDAVYLVGFKEEEWLRALKLIAA